MRKMRIRANNLLVLCILAGFIAFSSCTKNEEVTYQPVKAREFVQIDSLIQSNIDQENIPGAVVQVEIGGKIVHRQALGYAELYKYGMEKLNSPVKMDTESMFDLASLTKVFATTFGIMKLVDEGLIALDDPVHKYLSQFDGDKSEITIRQLLTHTSGLNEWQPMYYHASNSKETLDYIGKLPLKYKPGEGRHYSDLGFMSLGYIIEHVSGKRLDAFVKQNIYDPLGLKHIGFNPKEHGFDHFAATSHGNPFERHMVYDDDFGYLCKEDPESWDGWRHYTLKGEVNDGNSYYANQGVAGHAGLFATIGDLQKLVNLLLNHGNYRGKQIISEDVISKFLTKDQYGNGLGWAMDPDIISAPGAPAGTFGHTGFTGTNVVVIPRYHASVIMLTNRQNVGPQKNGYYFNLNPLRRDVFKNVMHYIQVHKISGTK